MAFQTVTNLYPAPAMPGEVLFNGPEPRVEPRIIYSASTPNTFGFVFTESTAGDVQLGNTATAGGAGIFAGILISPKSSALFGTTAGGPLAPSLDLPNYKPGQLLKFGTVAVAIPAAASIGNLVTYTIATGAISATFAPTAAFTAAQSTTTLTVSAITAGNIGIGSVIKNASGQILGTVTALGTGTGGTGTYTLNTSATVSSAAMTANSAVSATTDALVPNAVVSVLPLSAAGTGFITLTN